MKGFSIIPLLLYLFLSFLGLAQEAPKTEYLFDSKKVKVSGFGNTFGELSFIDGSVAYSSGGGGAFLFNYKTYLGIYSHDLVTSHSFSDIYPEGHNPITSPLAPSHINNRIRFNHFGLWVGYIHNPFKLVHVGSSIRIGGGYMALFDSKIDFREFDDHHRDWVGVVTPEIDLEMNIVRWFKINAGLGYRIVLGVDNSTYVNSLGDSNRTFKASQFSSPIFNVKLMFGAFGPKKNGKINNN